ncbi:MAG: PQQ-binding-like beta-propeller repeat protein [Acidimicrobiales bacterium]
MTTTLDCTIRRGASLGALGLLALLAVACGTAPGRAPGGQPPASGRAPGGPGRGSAGVGAPGTPGRGSAGVGAPGTPVSLRSVAGGWTTYHGDLVRSGNDRSGASFDPLRPAWSSPALDGQVYAQPLVWRALVIVATENDTIYGFHARTGKIAWKTHVGTPVPASDLPCGNVDPLGILSTPTIDASTGRLFAVAETLVAGGGVSHKLVALDASTGKMAFSESADPGSMTNPRAQQQRGALAVSKGRVYVVYGGLYGDCGSYGGFVVAAPASGPGNLASYRVPTRNGGAIWDPGGPSIDSAGNVYVATGNGASTIAYDQGDSVLELSPGLRLLSSFAPSSWAADNQDDADLGSTGPVLLSGGLVFQVGKEATGYLLHQGHLGGIGGSVASANVCFSIGGTAQAGADIYASCRGGVKDVRVGGPSRLRVAWQGPAGATGPPVIAGSLVWSVGGSTLYGLRPSTGAIVVRQALEGGADPYVTPGLGDGLMVVPTGQGVEAFTG